MRIRAVAMWASLGMVATTAAAFAIPLSPSSPTAGAIQGDGQGIVSDDGAGAVVDRLVTDGTLGLDVRLGHDKVSAGAPADTFLFASVTSADPPAAFSIAPLNLAIVIDRSGSMKGERIANAIAAAVGTIDRMRDGDTATVVTFDTQAQTIVGPTRIDVASRETVKAQIRSIRLGGDTCISCGLDLAMSQVMSATSLGLARSDSVSRILLLSDGATNHGVRDLPGLRALASSMRNRGCSISTIGVDVDFDEKVMAALAAESNGRHHFVANASDLPAVFAQEFDSLLTTVAREGELSVELAPGVVVEQVFDRSFRREGARIVVPFGTFSAKQEKTVLMRLRVPADVLGKQAVANVKLTYQDLVHRTDGQAGGDIALRVVPSGAEEKDLDPFVAARLERSRTAETLTQANALFAQGRVEEAKKTLESRKQALDVTASRARRLAATDPFDAPKAKSLDRDFEGQAAVVAQAEANFAAAATPAPAPVAPGKGSVGASGGGFAQPPAASRLGREQIKTNEAAAAPLRL